MAMPWRCPPLRLAPCSPTRDEQHFAEQPAVFDEAGDEAAEVEPRQLAGQAGAAGDEDELTGPLRGEHGEGLDHRAAALNGAARVLKQHALAVALGQHHHPRRAAIVTLQQGQRGQRRELQPIYRAAAEPGFEADVFGGQQQVGGVGLVAGRPAELVRQVRRVSGDVVQARDQAQGAQRGRAGWRRDLGCDINCGTGCSRHSGGVLMDLHDPPESGWPSLWVRSATQCRSGS